MQFVINFKSKIWVSVMLAIVLFGCVPNESIDLVDMDRSTKVATLDCREFNGIGYPERAIWVLNGEVLGSGDEGFRNAIEILVAEPPDVLYFSPDFSNSRSNRHLVFALQYYENEMTSFLSGSNTVLVVGPGPVLVGQESIW